MDYDQLINLYNTGTVRYVIIAILTLIVYKLGFERPLPVLKKLVVYIVLVIGCFPLFLLSAFGLPIVSALIAAALLMVAVRIRRVKYMEDSSEKGNNANEAK